MMSSKKKQRLEAQKQRQDFVESLTQQEREILARELSDSFCKAFPPSPEIRLAAYWSLPYEADTRPLLTRLLAQKGSVFLPCTRKNAPLTFRKWDLDAPLIKGPFHVMEPESSFPEESSFTHILVPLLAFDLSGNRLGYGQGHYDRTLTSLRSLKRPFPEKPLFIGFAFEVQKVDTIVTDPHDQVLDAIVTEKTFYNINLK
tara:strand:- start:1783 stop:2385 length:603 start_codon:yes stop_codon:yes gene_type:complete